MTYEYLLYLPGLFLLVWYLILKAMDYSASSKNIKLIDKTLEDIRGMKKKMNNDLKTKFRDPETFAKYVVDICLLIKCNGYTPDHMAKVLSGELYALAIGYLDLLEAYKNKYPQKGTEG